MSNVVEFTPAAWVFERHKIANYGFYVLSSITYPSERFRDFGMDLPGQITNAFNQVNCGMEYPEEKLAPNRAEFLRAADNPDEGKRAELFLVALANLSEAVGFAIEP